jgi:hypothetical protein
MFVKVTLIYQPCLMSMKNYSHVFGIILGTLLIDSNLVAQTKAPDAIPQTSIESVQGRYFNSTVGMGLMTFRDFATSPLYFTGLGFQFGLGWERIGEKRTFLLETQMHLGSVLAEVPESEYFQPFGGGFMSTFQIYSHYHFQLQRYRKDWISYWVGPSLALNNNIRVVPNFQNNAFGGEGFINLMASGKVLLDISRKSDFVIDLGFVEFNFRQKVKSLSFQTDIGLLNMNRRPGYAYYFDSELDGTSTSPVEYLFGNYDWRVNGWRLMTRLDYAWYLPNGNGHKFSYHWNAIHAPGGYETFQMASHLLGYTLIFKRGSK